MFVLESSDGRVKFGSRAVSMCYGIFSSCSSLSGCSTMAVSLVISLTMEQSYWTISVPSLGFFVGTKAASRISPIRGIKDIWVSQS